MRRSVQRKQEAIFARTGEEATPEELGVSEREFTNAIYARPKFVPGECANELYAEERPDEELGDFIRYLDSLSVKGKKALVRGDLAALAKAREYLRG
jgi:hypothetical protein